MNRKGALDFFPTASVINLSSGETKVSYGGGIPAGLLNDTVAGRTGRILADNGTAVFINGQPGAGDSGDGTIGPAGGELLILAAGAVQLIPRPLIETVFQDATIDASGQTIVFTEHNYITNEDSLRIASPGVATSRPFVADGYSASIADDGRQVLYLSQRTGTAQAYLIGIDGEHDRALTHEPEGIAQGILSGDGTVAYVVTAGARVLKIATESGDVQQLTGRTPYLDLMFPSRSYSGSVPVLGWYYGPALAPGKRVFLTGGGFPSLSEGASPPFPTSLDGLSVSIQGHPAPIAAILRNGISLLVPPEVDPNSQGTIHLDADSFSYFEPRLDGTAPVYASAAEPVVSIHEDWSALVSGDNPARRGETLHTYAVGLGPTTPVVPLGQATPLMGPLSQLSTPLSCIDYTWPWSNGTSPVEILFAGLAPGMVAVYQVDWRVPASAGPNEYFTMGCLKNTYLIVSVPLAPV
ncbi:MAG: hypothetical protein LAQ69_06625 [Acidobacteriia bacterium]|nr:hypothetical protein [Terriglobia bacterium]